MGDFWSALFRGSPVYNRMAIDDLSDQMRQDRMHKTGRDGRQDQAIAALQHEVAQLRFVVSTLTAMLAERGALDAEELRRRMAPVMQAEAPRQTPPRSDLDDLADAVGG